MGTERTTRPKGGDEPDGNLDTTDIPAIDETDKSPTVREGSY